MDEKQLIPTVLRDLATPTVNKNNADCDGAARFGGAKIERKATGCDGAARFGDAKSEQKGLIAVVLRDFSAPKGAEKTTSCHNAARFGVPKCGHEISNRMSDPDSKLNFEPDSKLKF